jgi:hypothetical protein
MKKLALFAFICVESLLMALPLWFGERLLRCNNLRSWSRAQNRTVSDLYHRQRPRDAIGNWHCRPNNLKTFSMIWDSPP